MMTTTMMMMKILSLTWSSSPRLFVRRIEPIHSTASIGDCPKPKPRRLHHRQQRTQIPNPTPEPTDGSTPNKGGGFQRRECPNLRRLVPFADWGRVLEESEGFFLLLRVDSRIQNVQSQCDCRQLAIEVGLIMKCRCEWCHLPIGGCLRNELTMECREIGRYVGVWFESVLDFLQTNQSWFSRY